MQKIRFPLKDWVLDFILDGSGSATLEGSLKPTYWSVAQNCREMDICLPSKLTGKIDAASQIKSA